MQTLSTSFLRPAQAAWEKGILRTMHSPGVYSFRDLQDRGYSRADIERLMRDGKLLQIGGGTDEIQISRIARDLLGR